MAASGAIQTTTLRQIGTGRLEGRDGRHAGSTATVETGQKDEADWRWFRVETVREESSTVKSFLLSSADGVLLRPAEPGAHIQVRTGKGHVRQYSLLPSPDTSNYRIGVGLAPGSRGGSRWMHDALRPGDMLVCSPPRNSFPVSPLASTHVMFAGGIGITPFPSMIEHFKRVDQPYRLYYMCRSLANSAFAEELRELCGSNLTLHCLDAEGGEQLDIQGVIARLPDDAHVYCCGPASMIDAVVSAPAKYPPHHIHIEQFEAPAEATAEHAYSVNLALSQREIKVSAGASLLASLRQQGVDVPSSCETGSCGTCVLAYRDGSVQHNDTCLTEKARDSFMAVCVSHACSDSITLDI